MTTHPASSTRTNARQMIRRYSWWLGLGLLLVVAALTADHFTSAPAAATPAVSSQASALDPMTQSVRAYLRAHSGEQPAPTPAPRLDPAQQGVIGYVHAHDRVEQPTTLWDQVTQAVRGYLRAHSK